MKLYHYTTESGAAGIARDQVIRCAKANPLNGGKVSLTTDETGGGHGLPDGREVPVKLAEDLGGRIKVANGRFFCHDHTEWRVCLDLDEQDPCLVKADQLHDSQQLLAMDIAACHPEYVNLPDNLLIQALDDIRSGKRVRKSPTWWYYEGDLPLPAQAMIEKRAGTGTYEPASPGC